MQDLVNKVIEHKGRTHSESWCPAKGFGGIKHMMESALSKHIRIMEGTETMGENVYTSEIESWLTSANRLHRVNDDVGAFRLISEVILAVLSLFDKLNKSDEETAAEVRVLLRRASSRAADWLANVDVRDPSLQECAYLVDKFKSEEQKKATDSATMHVYKLMSELGISQKLVKKVKEGSGNHNNSAGANNEQLKLLQQKLFERELVIEKILHSFERYASPQPGRGGAQNDESDQEEEPDE